MSEYNIQMNKYNALNAGYDQLYPKPMKHANTHAKDGSDPITPASIGAYTKTEADTLLAKKVPFGYGWGEANAVNAPYNDPDYITKTCIFVAASGNIPADGIWIGFAYFSDNSANGNMLLTALTGPVGSMYTRYKTSGNEWSAWKQITTETELDTKVSKSGGVMTGELAIRMDGVDTSFLNSAEALIIRSVESGGWDSRRTLQIKTKTAQPDFNKSLTYSRSDDGWLEYVLLHTGNAQTLGFPKIAIGSYVGTGTYSSSNPNTLNFDFEPKVLIVVADGANSNFPGFVIVRGQGYSNGIGSYSNSSAGYALTTTWSGNSISWYSTNTFDFGKANAQLNAEGVTYRYIALG